MNQSLFLDLTKPENTSFIHALEFANVGFLQYEINDTIQFINDHLFNLLELNTAYEKAPDVIGKNINELFTSLPLQIEIQNLLIENKHLHGVEINLTTITNKNKSAFIDAHLIEHPVTNKLLIQIIVKDNTTQKESETALRLSEEKFSKAFYISPDSININRLIDGLYIDANQGFYNLTGYTKKEVIGKTSIELSIWDNPADRNKLVNELKEKGEVNSLEFQFRRKNGSVGTGLMSAKLIEINGEPCILNITHDITQRKLAEQALITSETKYRAIIELGVDAIILGNPEGVIIGANLQASILTGYPKDELLSLLNIRFLFTEESVIEHPLRYDLLKEGFIVRTERIICRKDGTFVPIEMNTKMMPDNTYQTFIRDMTERKKAELLSQKILETESENRIKSQFLANLSHEIRNPLNGIIGLTNTLIKSQLNNEQRKYLEAIAVSSQNLLTVLNDVLNYSKIEANKIELHNEVFILKELIDSICLIYENKAHEKGILFISDLKGNFSTILQTDSNKLKQIIINLLSNAFKFTTKGSISINIKLSIETSNTSTLHCNITDTGIGIKSEDFKMIFKSFTQIDDSTSKEYQGTGLGLVISKNYVELLGGSINFDSTYGTGSSFYFNIPVKIVDKKPIDSALQTSQQNNINLHSKPLSILIAEDDGINRMYLANFLKTKGFKIEEAKNGFEVLEKIKLKQFDIILMDCQMPKMDGFEATKQIRKLEKISNKRVNIIAISGYSANDLKDKFGNTDFDRYIIKPIIENDLLEQIASLK